MRSACCAGLFSIALACDSPTAPADPREGWTLQPGILLHHGVPAFLQVPDSIRRDVPFQVGFTTFGPGCAEEGGTEVEVNALTAEVHPMDWIPDRPPAETCTDRIVRVFARIVQVRFGTIGEGVIRINGRREPGSTKVIFTARVVVH
ncbi:MAG: hypothetical protein L0271_00690 [Gemmatimonadetes bacterium]|nr:hypothetical protein [Gemmatimonadota bacterium]